MSRFRALSGPVLRSPGRWRVGAARGCRGARRWIGAGMAASRGGCAPRDGYSSRACLRPVPFPELLKIASRRPASGTSGLISGPFLRSSGGCGGRGGCSGEGYAGGDPYSSPAPVSRASGHRTPQIRTPEAHIGHIRGQSKPILRSSGRRRVGDARRRRVGAGGTARLRGTGVGTRPGAAGRRRPHEDIPGCGGGTCNGAETPGQCW